MSVLSNNISVIIPTYNRKELVTKTIRNLLSQSVVPSEIIIVDDHSTDGTLHYLQDHFKDQIILISNKGKGPGAARNTGFEISKGEYIKFFDSDDLMTLNTFEAQIEALEKSEKGFVYSPYFYAKQTKEGLWELIDLSILNYYPFSEKAGLTQLMLLGLFITIPGMLFRRELLDSVGPWRTDISSSEDWDFLFRISLEEPLPAHTNTCAFLYRIHGSQTTDLHFNDYERDTQKWLFLSEIYERYCNNDRVFSSWQKMLFKNKLYQLLRNYSKEHEFFGPHVEKYNTVANKLVWQYCRLRQKIGRLKTGTNWQPEHGPFQSKEQFMKYLSLIEIYK